MVIAGATKPTAISEQLVTEVWERQILKRPLYTTSGQKLEVVYYGRRCCGHGPDFRGAVIAFDGELRRGDVEVHVRDADWQVHGHHVDPAYDSVILHVVMWPTNGFLPHKSNGEIAPVLCVEPHLPVAIDGLPQFLPTIPYVPFRCTKTRNVDELLAILDTAGQQRLRGKAAALEGDLSVFEPEEVLYRAIMTALGYTRNTAAFAQLAEIAPLSIVKAIALGERVTDRAMALQAFFLGKAGLLPRQRQKENAPSPQAKQVGGFENPPLLYEMQLEAKWQEMAMWDDGCRVELPWHFAGVRPENFPTRRLIGAAELFASVMEKGLCETFVQPLRDNEPEAACQALERILWVREFIGKARAAEIIINVILPFAVAYGQATSDGQLSRRAGAAFRCYRYSAENEISRYMSGLIADSSSSSSVGTACRQQGLLYLYKMWCIDKRCGDCPLARISLS